MPREEFMAWLDRMAGKLLEISALAQQLPDDDGIADLGEIGAESIRSRLRLRRAMDGCLRRSRKGPSSGGAARARKARRVDDWMVPIFAEALARLRALRRRVSARALADAAQLELIRITDRAPGVAVGKCEDLTKTRAQTFLDSRSDP